jgi:hypothetical protein
LSELPEDFSFSSFIDLASGMSLSHIKFFKRLENNKVGLTTSLSSILSGSIATELVTLDTTSFEELEGQEIVVDLWGCSTPSAGSFATNNLDL